MLKPAVLLTAAVLLLAGCSATQPDDGMIHIVASTNVYGDIAQTIGGDGVQVTSIIDDPAQDPHQFEANGRVQLALSRADIVIVNGGGYDDFATTMLAASGNDDARVIDAVELSGYDASADGFNEHVWYDYPTVQTVAKAIAAEPSPIRLSTLCSRAAGTSESSSMASLNSGGVRFLIPDASST